MSRDRGFNVNLLSLTMPEIKSLFDSVKKLVREFEKLCQDWLFLGVEKDRIGELVVTNIESEKRASSITAPIG